MVNQNWKKEKKNQIKISAGQASFLGMGQGGILCTLPSAVFSVITSKISSLCYLKLALKIAFSLGSYKAKEM